MTHEKNDDFRASFFEECEELIEALQDGLDRLENNRHDIETMNAIFRAVHSIKGGAGAFRLDSLVAYAHHFETALDKLRSEQVEADDGLLELLRRCGDHLSDLVEATREDDNASLGSTQELMDRLSKEFGLDATREDEQEAPDFEPVTLDLGFAPDSEDAVLAPTRPSEFDISFTATPALFVSGNDPMVLFRALEQLGPLEVMVDLGPVPALETLDPDSCYMHWKIRINTEASEDDIREVFEFVEADCHLDISKLHDDVGELPDLPELPAAGQHETPDTSPDTCATPTLYDIIGDVDGAREQDAPRKAVADTPSRNDDRKPESKKPAGTIRVDLEKVDKLINLVGELVIKEAMLSQSISDFQLPSESEVSVGLDNLKQLASEIQEGVMSVRAQPVKPLIQRMSRIVREASAATGKQVRFLTEGEYTEVDKTVVERLVDPLTHMIRNAVDHGLEPADRRIAAGKSAEGTIMLTAAHRSGRVVIEVSDDGGGIDRDRVHQIAIARGLVAENAELSPSEIDNLLFVPGFSSKDEVSELSGRGVGLDVVRSEIAGLGGRVSIQSQPGEGTTFTISLPLTLAVLEGMVIKVAEQTMVMPISAIQETLQPKASDIDVIGRGNRILRNRNEMVPIIDLGLFFGFRSAPAELTQHVLLLSEAANHQRFALVADDIQDQRQVVIKSLETNYQQINGVAAATILGDGRIALIIDPDNIISAVGGGAQTDFEVSKAG